MTSITFSQLGNLGRTGNSMFQIASTLGIAQKNNLFYFFPEWKYQNYFDNKLPIKDDIKMELRPYKTIVEISFSHQDFILSSNYHYEIKNSYLQSYKYWEPHATHLIKKYFEPTKIVLDKTLKVWYKILSTNITCAVHFRLKDYIEFSDYHTNLQLTDYYKDAIRLMESQNFTDEPTKYIIFSDDIAWCKKNALELMGNGLHINNVLFSDSQNEVEDLVLQTLVSHNIIANSTFSYWGAYLNKNKSKLVITPGGIKYPWFGKKSLNDTKDLLLKDWCKL